MLSQTLKGLLLLLQQCSVLDVVEEEGGLKKEKPESERVAFNAVWIGRLIFVYQIEVKKSSKWKGYYL